MSEPNGEAQREVIEVKIRYTPGNPPRFRIEYPVGLPFETLAALSAAEAYVRQRMLGGSQRKQSSLVLPQSQVGI